MIFGCKKELLLQFFCGSAWREYDAVMAFSGSFPQYENMGSFQELSIDELSLQYYPSL